MRIKLHVVWIKMAAYVFYFSWKLITTRTVCRDGFLSPLDYRELMPNDDRVISTGMRCVTIQFIPEKFGRLQVREWSRRKISEKTWILRMIPKRVAGNEHVQQEKRKMGRKQTTVKYSPKPLYGYPLYADTSLLRTVFFVPGESPYNHFL